MKNYQNYLLDLENLKTSGYCFREISNCEIQQMEWCDLFRSEKLRH